MPMESELASGLFFYLCYVPFSIGIPMAFSVFCAWDISRKQLMPASGRRRTLSMFLFRIILSCFLLWVPFLMLSLVANFVAINRLIIWLGAAMSHLVRVANYLLYSAASTVADCFRIHIIILFCIFSIHRPLFIAQQGVVCAGFYFMDDDIRKAFYLVITCQPASREDEEDGCKEEDARPATDLEESSNIRKINVPGSENLDCELSSTGVSSEECQTTAVSNDNVA